jgi:hypothetical protein
MALAEFVWHDATLLRVASVPLWLWWSVVDYRLVPDLEGIRYLEARAERKLAHAAELVLHSAIIRYLSICWQSLIHGRWEG